jgi:hypothetical protein
MSYRPFVRAVLFLLLLVFESSWAAPASSTNYSITHDVVSGGGGESSSANYKVRAAAGQSTAIGVSNSTNYTANAGFHAIRKTGGPSITGVWPGTGTLGQPLSVFVFGSGFDLTPLATEVYFNDVRQWLVQVVTPDMLIARVTVDPSLFGPVTVKTSAGTAVSPTNFGTTVPGLQITGVWPGTVTDGVPVSVFVFGSEFDLAPGATEVFFNGIQQWLVQVVTPDMLIVRTTPTAAMSGPVTVTTPAGSASSGTDLVVVP